eukprot:1151734-Pelagomonas_calceolata.AAC.3
MQAFRRRMRCDASQQPWPATAITLQDQGEVCRQETCRIWSPVIEQDHRDAAAAGARLEASGLQATTGPQKLSHDHECRGTRGRNKVPLKQTASALLVAPDPNHESAVEFGGPVVFVALLALQNAVTPGMGQT